jgi:hypothetical protein
VIDEVKPARGVLGEALGEVLDEVYFSQVGLGGMSVSKFGKPSGRGAVVPGEGRAGYAVVLGLGEVKLVVPGEGRAECAVVIGFGEVKLVVPGEGRAECAVVIGLAEVKLAVARAPGTEKAAVDMCMCIPYCSRA